MKDLTLNHSFFTNTDLRKLIIPLVIEQFLSILVGLLDTMMVSQVGEAAVSAVSLVDSVNTLFVFAFAALGTGGAVIVGQYLGRKDVRQAGHGASQLMLFMTEISLLIMVLLYLFRPLVLGRVFGGVEPDVAHYANTYYLITEASTPFLAIYSAGSALFRVMGNSRVSMWISLMMNGINVAGNALLLFGFGMGVEGVAIPTLVSRMAAAGAMAFLLSRPGKKLQLERLSWKHDPYIVKYILRYGVTNGLESSMFQLGKILLLSTVSVLGTAAVAANAIGNVVACLGNITGEAMGLAMITVVSQCVGAGAYREVRFYIKKLMKWIYASYFCCSMLVVLCLPLILRVYNVSPEAEFYARQIILLHATAGILLWPVSFALPQALRAAGDTRYTMLVGSISMWTIRVGLGIFLVRVCGTSVLGIWISMLVDWVVRSTLFVLRILGHRWEEKAIQTQD